MDSHQNHSRMTKMLNGDNSMSTHSIGMCNTSSESSHWGDWSLKISTLLIFQLSPKGFLGISPFFAFCQP